MVDSMIPNSPASPGVSIKPPIGIVPQHLWIEQRISDLTSALQRQFNSEHSCQWDLVLMWHTEIAQLLEMLETNKNR